MRIRLKRLRDQTVVVTGATSGVGLAIARKAAARGARLVLAARNEDALNALAEELRATGVEAEGVTADVGVEAEVQRIADTAVNRFGGFDTWINNAGVSIYGPLLEISIEDQRRLFDTNYWGVVYGSLIAVRHLKEYGGALINIGSVLSDVAVPIQGAYSASKHAVKGFTDALRMELEAEGIPVSVTLIKPSALDTPYKDHAENYLDVEPRVPPPVYSAEVAADAVLHAAEHPIRDMVVGGGGKLLSLAGVLAPRLTDRLMEGTMTRLQRTRRPRPPDTDSSLYRPGEDGRAHSDYPEPVLQHSLYTQAVRHPLAAATLTIGTSVLLWSLLRRR